MRVALIHDHLAQDGGAERVLKILAEMYPDAPIYTLLYEQKNADKYFRNRHIETSIIQRLPWGVKKYQWYMPFMPMAVEFFDLRNYDLVISSVSAFAKGVITTPETLHLCYCHTPTRYLWSDTHQYINELKYNKYFKKVISLFLNYIRIWDKQASERVDKYIANSKTTKRRIKKYYNREAKVIFPPVEVDNFSISENLGDYFLIGCRLAPYKRVDIVVEAFKKMPDKKLKIFGSGVDQERLKKIAEGAPNIEFLGRITDQEKYDLYCKCLAFINPQEEDAGITPVEAMAAGRPVIAYRRGGVLETVIEGRTGLFFDKQTPEDLIEAVRKFEPNNFNPAYIKDHAKQFSQERFKLELRNYINKEWENHKDSLK